MDTKKQNELLDDLLKDCKTPEEVLGQNGLLKQLTQKLVERALEGEMNEHLGYKKHPNLGIPNTTNPLEGIFAELKTKLRNHAGITDEMKIKLTDHFLSK